jgi:hypothetical protein
MPRNQIENPPTHAETAPQGEIRQEPLGTLRLFSLIIAIAFALPAAGMVAGGFITSRMWLGITGLIILVSLGVGYYLILWQIMKSRKLDPSER